MLKEGFHSPQATPSTPLPAKPEVSKAYQFIEYQLRVAVLTNAVPFTFNKELRTFHLDTKSLKFKIWVLFMLIAMVAETVQVLYELFRAHLDPTMSRGDWCLILFVALSWTLITALHCFTMKNGNLMVNYINQVVRMRAYFTEAKLPHNSEHNMVRGHLISIFLQGFFQCLLVATEGYMGKKQYLFCHVPEQYRNVGIGSVWFIYAYYRVITNFMVGYFYAFSNIFHAMTCNQVLAFRKTENVSLKENLKTYRMLQLLCNRFNETYSKRWVPSMTMFAVSNIILGNFGTLRFAGTMEFHNYMNFPLMTSLMMLLVFTSFPPMASIKETSEAEAIRMLYIGIQSNRELGQNPCSSYSSSRTNSLANSGEPSQEAFHILKNQKNATGKGGGSTTTGRITTRTVTSRRITPRATFDDAYNELELKDNSFRNPESKSHSKSMAVILTASTFNSNLIRSGKLKEAKCCARSCSILSVKMGSFYPIKKSTIFTICEFIVCNTISALITT